MRSLREPLLEAELNRDRRSSLWHFATDIMVRTGSFLLFTSTEVDGVQSKFFFFLRAEFLYPTLQVILPAIQVSPSELLFFNSLKRSSVMDISQSKESRACLAYLLFVQLIAIDSFPAVFRCDEKQ